MDPKDYFYHLLPTYLISWKSLSRYFPDWELSEWCMIFLSPAVYWIVSTFFFFLSKMKLTSVELHRIPTNQKMRPANRVTVKEVIVHVAIQHVIQGLVAVGLTYLTRPQDMSTRSIESWPLLICKLIASALFLDTYQYWWHRWMHVNKWLYRNFHSVHHRLTVPYAYGALYNHPIEGFIMDILGSAIPAALMDMHPWTATLFFCVATLKTCSDHCGYTLPWDPFQIIFPNNAAYHDIHHWGKGRMYNFSQPFFTFWDHWMDTDFETSMKRKAAVTAALKKSQNPDELTAHSLSSSSDTQSEKASDEDEAISLKRKGNKSNQETSTIITGGYSLRKRN